MAKHWSMCVAMDNLCRAVCKLGCVEWRGVARVWVLLLTGKKKKVLLYACEEIHTFMFKEKNLFFLIFPKALWRTVLSNSLRSDGLVFSSAEDRGALMRVFNNPSVVQ